MVGGGWQWLVIGGWSPLLVGGVWRLAIGGGWRLVAVGGPGGAVLNKKKRQFPKEPPVAAPLVGVRG